MSQALNLKQNTNLQKNECKQLEEFYNFFYDFKFPLYLHKKYRNTKKKSYATTNYFINNFKDIRREIDCFHKDIFISIFDKAPEYTDKKSARNTINNSRATTYFVVDIDSPNYIINEKLSNKISYYIYNTEEITIPLPTAIINSGSGLHLYYKIRELDIYKSQNKNYFIKLYKEAISTIQKAIIKELETYKKSIKKGFFDEVEIAKIKDLKVDTSLQGSPSQLIRLVGSYNYEAGENCKIIKFSKSITYTLGELIQEYSPKYVAIDTNKEFNILSEKEFKNKNKILKVFPNGYTEKDTINLNNSRLLDLKTLIQIRKNNNTLIGTRQKIMCQAAWCLINNNHNGATEVDILSTLKDYGSLIGDEFSSEKYCKDKIKHITDYHKTHKKLSNSTICRWLEIEEVEMKNLPGLWISDKKKRKAKKVEKLSKKEKARELLSKGYTQREIAKKLGISLSTVNRWSKK